VREIGELLRCHLDDATPPATGSRVLPSPHRGSVHEAFGRRARRHGHTRRRHDRARRAEFAQLPAPRPGPLGCRARARLGPRRVGLRGRWCVAHG
jgi:hypothetical protein